MAQIAKLLKYCPNLTKISLFTETPLEINTDEIFEQKYPKLRHIHWLKARPSDLKTEKLRQFLQENDQIQCMEWSFRFMDEADIDMLFPVIRTIVDCAPHLQHLYLKVSVSFHYWDTVRFSVFCDYLKILCGRNNFKSLYLNFRDDFTLSVPELFTSHADSLAGFKQLTQIQIHIFHLPFRSLMQSLLPYVHLRSLILRQPPTLDNSTETITLPQIEEIFINDWTREDRMVLMQFVRYWVNLKKIIIHDTDSCCETVSEVAELNLERTKLKDACELTIYTDTKGTTTNLDHKLVKLKYVKFEYFDSFAAKCMLSVQ
ncbi:hypothetical protein HA402_000778 [Bradysia odoriphaga]|nr:hypothetical protein HA402_000778 [Bradysia odoriphaga]